MTAHAYAMLAIFIPMVSAVFSHLFARLPKVGTKVAKAICLFSSYITLFLVISLLLAVEYEQVKVKLFVLLLPTGPINLELYIDHLALIPAFLSSLFTALALTYNLHYLSPYNRAYKIGWEFNRSYSFILLFNGAMLGTLFSNNLLSLLIFWELISLCSYVLISLRSEDQFCVFASFKSFIMTHIGSMALLLAAVVIYFATGTLDFSEIGLKIPPGNQLLMLIFPLLLIAALPKTVLFPLHTWLPDGTVAPTSATVVFHVCGFQSGVYLIIRFFFNIFHNHIISGFMMPLPLLFGSISLWSFVISLIGAITLIVGALNGIVENDFKRIVAYGTISGLGCIVMATGLGTSLCVASSLFLMISHALCYGLLFLCAGSVIYASGKHNINELGGLHRYMPITSLCCLIGAVTLSTAPLLSEFASKFLLLHAIINVGSIFFTVMAVLACVFNAAIALRLLHSVFMQRSADEAFSFPVKDPPISMSVPMILVSAILITFGVSPAIPLSLLVIPAVKQMGFPMNIVSRLEFIGSPIGFWNPMAVAISLLTLLAVFAGVMVFSSRFAAAYRRPVSEETFKPFICGEDLNLLDGPHGYHFYHALTNVFRVEGFCNTSNVDHVYNVFSKKWNDFAVKMRLLDIQQSYVAAISCFLAGAVIVMLVAILMV